MMELAISLSQVQPVIIIQVSMVGVKMFRLLFIIYPEFVINACASIDTESITMLCSIRVSGMARGISVQPRIMASDPW